MSSASVSSTRSVKSVATHGLRIVMGGLSAAALLMTISLSSVSAQVDSRIPLTKKPTPKPQEQTRIIQRPRQPIVGPKLKVKVPDKLIMPDMVKLDSGTFIMGGEVSTSDDGPEHGVQISAFEISKTPITNKQFRQFVETAEYKTEAERTPTAYERENNISWRTFANDRDDYPVVWITFNDAYAYCRWLTLVTKPRPVKATVIDEENEENSGAEAEVTEPYRLPTEAEWEFAARGELARMPYPWGETPDKDKLNSNSSSENRPNTIEAARKYLKPVGQQPANSVGVQDMAGNVGQWCYDFYAADFYAKSPQYNPYGPDEGKEHSVRGGSWFESPNACRVFSRQHYNSDERNARTSFRILRALPKQVIIIEDED